MFQVPTGMTKRKYVQRQQSRAGGGARPLRRSGGRLPCRGGIAFRSDEGKPVRIKVVFGLLYRSQTPPEEPPSHFEKFTKIILPPNAWPPVPKFFCGMMARMGRPPYTLPLLRFVPEPESESGKAKEGWSLLQARACENEHPGKGALPNPRPFLAEASGRPRKRVGITGGISG